MFGVELTVGMVSSIIAACILLIQYTLPLFLGIVLAGLIQNASTAITWSVITTLLHNSNLHTLLFSDSASTTNIARPVLILSYIAFLSLGLIALSGVLTPLGIRDHYEGRDETGVRFEWTLDNDSFALGTAERSLYGMSRVCGFGEETCPGQEGETVVEEEGSFQVAPYQTITVDETASAWVETTTSTSSIATSFSVSFPTTTNGTSSGTGSTGGAATSSRTSTATDSTASDTSTGSSAPTRSGTTSRTSGTVTSGSSSGPATSGPSSVSVPTASSNTPVPTQDRITTPTASAKPTASATASASASPASTATTNLLPVSVQTLVSVPSASGGGPTAVQTVPPVATTAVQQLPDLSVRAAASSAYMALHRRSDPEPKPDLKPKLEATVPAPAAVPRRRLHRRAVTKKYRIGSSVPESLAALFSRASYYGANVASVFDIQFRNYMILNAPQHKLASGLGYTIGQFRFLETLILTRGYRLIDGLVVDTRGSGGLGFRAHAVPDREKKRYGAGWSETLLWLEPATTCVANNVSLQVTTGDDGAVSVLVDTGGLAALVGVQDPDIAAETGGVPDLAGRAWRGAFYFNKEVAAAVGAGEGSDAEGEAAGFEIEGGGVWMDALRAVSDSLGDSQFVVHRVPLGAKISEDGSQNVTRIDTHCAGLTADTPSGAPLVTCGLIVGSPLRTDASSSTLAGTYRYPLYTCATAIRASLQTTSFTSNGTSRDLTSLALHNSTLAPTTPLWGIEHHSNLTARQISPLWGLLHPDDEDNAAVTATRAPYLYLPAGQGAGGIADSLAGTGAYQYAAGLVYEASALTPDYSGKTNYALYRRWAEVTADAQSAAALPGLVWTDVMANLVTSVAAGGKGVGVVTVFRRVIAYDFRYAVPVGLLVALWGSVWGVAMVFWAGRRVRVREMRQLLNQVSTGRVVVNMLQGSKESSLASSRWARSAGRTVVGLECRTEQGAEGWEREGDDLVSGLVVGFSDNPQEGRVLELLKKSR